MHITTIKAADGSRPEIIRPTDAEQQNEYDYIMAENMTRKLLDKGMISVDEFDKIMAKNRETFSPLFSRI